MSEPWLLDEAFDLCRAIEAISPAFGCHVALTGGMLYKDGPRKDCDLVLYRIRQVERVDFAGLFAALAKVDVLCIAPESPRWCVKATWRGKPLDLFFPDHGGEYPAAPDLDLEKENAF
jgi:hypothetical protein